MAQCVKVRWGISLFFTVILAVICGFISLIQLLIDMVRKGPLRVLYVRRRNARPEILSNAAFGSHEIVRLRVSKKVLYLLDNTCCKLHSVNFILDPNI